VESARGSSYGNNVIDIAGRTATGWNQRRHGFSTSQAYSLRGRLVPIYGLRTLEVWN
jgi:hypothetical protein